MAAELAFGATNAPKLQVHRNGKNGCPGPGRGPRPLSTELELVLVYSVQTGSFSGAPPAQGPSLFMEYFRKHGSLRGLWGTDPCLVLPEACCPASRCDRTHWPRSLRPAADAQNQAPSVPAGRGVCPAALRKSLQSSPHFIYLCNQHKVHLLVVPWCLIPNIPNKGLSGEQNPEHAGADRTVQGL